VQNWILFCLFVTLRNSLTFSTFWPIEQAGPSPAVNYYSHWLKQCENTVAYHLHITLLFILLKGFRIGYWTLLMSPWLLTR